ncbi:MAG: aspartate/glutamate racemase family protein [Victivallales bacterium]|nr:aspartate/glutamate racemase family protein [Victivallales bacterium]
MAETIKILVTDSGLGGLSVAAELFERIKSERCFEKAELIFFNCRPSDASGYDQLGNNDLRAKVFSDALYAMCERFEPDIIMIACNTLSAVYDMGDFSRLPPVPVIGIIEDGTAEIADLMNAKPNLRMALFGTPTTVSSGIHEKILVECGMAPERVYYQDCLSLPNAIDRGARSLEVEGMVETFMVEAAQKAGNAKFAAALLCTHFGYSMPLFVEAAKRYGNFSGDFVNPNSAMVDSFLRKYEGGRCEKVDASIECFTHSTISSATREAMRPLISEISRDVAVALLNCVHSPDMFNADSIAKD